MSGTNRNIYLDNAPLDEALPRWLALCRDEGVTFPTGSETVRARDAAGRVTAGPLFAKSSSPPFHSSAMDGVAVRAEDTYGASEVSPVRLEPGIDAEEIDTGEPLPHGFDSVIMVEDLAEVAEGTFEIIRPAAPWQNVRPLGEDMVQTELVLPPGHLVRPADIGALLNAGITEVPVRRRPVIAIVPTGTELVEDPAELGPGKVMESNSWVLRALAEQAGARVRRMDLVPDDIEEIRRAVAQALDASDAVVVQAGTSAGREDFSRAVLEEFGSVAVHGVAMKPGKPVLLGAARGRPYIGLPGFPVANHRAAAEFLLPLVREFLGTHGSPQPTVKASLARKVFSTPGFDEFLQVKLGKVEDRLIAVPLPRGSGVSMSLVRSDGVVRVPAGSEGLSRWDEVEVLTYGDPDVEGTILAVGSHDVALDILAARLQQRGGRYNLASANVGSMGGIAAVAEGQAHVAGTHLLHPESGEFNVPYVLERMSPDDAVMVHLGWRTQGLMVPPGNPKGISGIADLARDGVSFINRQRGSGTRLLLDHELEKLGIDPEGIAGYGREVFTHTSVAAAVAGGAADAGLGLLAAAEALGVDFIPVASERYDLLVARSFAGTPVFEALLEALRDPGFAEEVEALGGYDLSDAGKIVSLEERHGD